MNCCLDIKYLDIKYKKAACARKIKNIGNKDICPFINNFLWSIIPI